MLPHLRIGYPTILMLLRSEPPSPPLPVKEKDHRRMELHISGRPNLPNYVGYVKKACYFPERPTSWEAKAAANVIAAPQLLAMGRFRSANFIRSNAIAQLREKESRDGALTQMDFIAFLCALRVPALRVPSEALLIRRAYRNDDFEGFATMKDQALLAIRCCAPNTRLVLRLRTRKSLSSGCIMSRPCFFSSSAPMAKKLFHSHSVWPCIAARSKTRGNVFPGYTAQNVNTAIAAVFAMLGIDHAQSYSSHGFRRGTPPRAKRKGAPMAGGGHRGSLAVFIFSRIRRFGR